MENLSHHLIRSLHEAKSTAGSDYAAFRRLSLEAVNAVEAKGDIDDRLAEAIDAVRFPDTDDIDWIIQRAVAILGPSGRSPTTP
ncbi:hypothetical protein GGR34_001498 [Microvirga flocculans]|uniref:Uncharacterized protein n=1 Tax=Microvirga flocculans TaxID=217168 RepID=A0A7W6IEU0_9HYPH|nr:hypothetical protein [Microvirga flocculans]MBB4039851.1 hypothetical protein [Microvirga flocculans]